MTICPLFHVFAVCLTLCLSLDHPDLCNENICFHINVGSVHTFYTVLIFAHADCLVLMGENCGWMSVLT